MVQHDHVPGLLTAQREAVRLHLLQHVPVADRGLHQRDTGPLHGELEAEVGHDGGHDGVLPQRPGLPHAQRQDREDLVAVDLVARVVHGQAAVGVPVVGDTEVGAVLDHRGPELVQVGGAAGVVDVQPVRLGADRDDLGPGPRERLRRHPGRRAVRPVDDDLQPVQAVGQHPDQVRDVLVEALVVVGDPAHPGAGRPVPRLTGAVRPVGPLDPVLQLVGELVPAAREELDPVVGHRVVAGREHHAQVRAERAGQVRDRRGRQHAHPQHVHPGAGQAGHHRGLQELPRRPRITSDHGHRPVPLERACLGQHVRRRDREAERQLRRQIRVGDTAHTVRAEESSHCCPPLRSTRRRPGRPPPGCLRERPGSTQRCRRGERDVQAGSD